MLISHHEFQALLERGHDTTNYEVIDMPQINLDWSLSEGTRLGSGQTLLHAVQDKNKFICMAIIHKHTGLHHSVITQYVEDHWDMWVQNADQLLKIQQKGKK